MFFENTMYTHSTPPFTWTPQKWVEPGFNPLYTFHMRTSNRVQPAFYTQVQPASEGGLNSCLSEFEVLEKMASRTTVDRRRNPSCADRLERGQYPKAAQCGQRMCDSCSSPILSVSAEHCQAVYAVLPALYS